MAAEGSIIPEEWSRWVAGLTQDAPRFEVPRLSPAQAPEAWARVGCSGTVDADAMWAAGFDPEEAAEWWATVRDGFQERGVISPRSAASAAQVWKVAGFSTAEASGWISVLHHDHAPHEQPLVAKQWRAAGFTSDTSRYWVESSFARRSQSVEMAVAFATAGWWPLDVAMLDLFAQRIGVDDYDAFARSWLEGRWDRRLALDLACAGFTTATAVPFLVSNEGREDLERGLEFHECKLQSLDQFKTEWICHEIFVAIGDDYEPQSWHERVVERTHHKHHRRGELVDAFGQPNADDVFLVRVIEFSDDSNEDGWTYASMMVKTALAHAAEDLGFPSDQVRVPDSYDTSQTVTLPDGCRIHAYARQVPRTKPWYRESRPPTGEELAHWAERQV